MPSPSDFSQRQRRSDGPLALVTGAAQGIGRAIAIALGDRDMRVAVHARPTKAARATVDVITGAGGWAYPVAADITDPAMVEAMAEEVTKTLGGVDLLVNNAGVTDRHEEPLWRSDPDEWWQVVAVNLRGPMLTCHEFLPGMIARGRGRVVNINSLAASRTDPAYSAYGAAKAGVMRMTDSLAAALADTGVHVFDLSPGLVRTDMTRRMAKWADVPNEDWTPIEDVVSVVLSLADGRGDELSGRFLRASDDVEELVRVVSNGKDPDARRLRVQRYGAGDPLPA